ncbi:2-phospho-L-lactate guanylyltransferase [Cellulomonas endometrii]|uniref:2-phospho-L-lactate guanylyltransferase n=1 Tax=Cellulomonas endometrii TaxID=3036301 RepID=UPI0024AE6524|nr:2-phospho-L-lactate guanylyltransferase [Cellulomonas endometrii]
MLLGRWVLVVPVKDARRGKTRLADVLEPGARAALVRAMALDTVEAVLAAPRVARVLVVTADPEVGGGAGALRRARVLPEPPAAADDARGGWASLDRAVSAGVAAARAEAPTAHVGVLLGDLPGLDPAELDAALAAAEAHPLAVVPDAEGTGTTLLTARTGERLQPAFGGGSAAAHQRLGHVVVDLPAGSTLRHDVDVPEDLTALLERGVGGRTGALLRRLGPLG